MKRRLIRHRHDQRSGLRSRPLALCHDELSVIADYRRSESAEHVSASAAS